jgi:D-aminoacyl-tRNA deacylase
MRALVQRVTEAWVDAPVDGLADGLGGGADADGAGAGQRRVVGRIGRGLVVLVGVTHADTEADAQRLAARVANLRILPDGDGALNVSVAEAGGALLVVSQFTLYADTRRGRRPSFVAAAHPDQAEPLIAAMVAALRATGLQVETGRFRTHMQVGLINDGPVTVLVES